MIGDRLGLLVAAAAALSVPAAAHADFNPSFETPPV
jgi:hypothetical protein